MPTGENQGPYESAQRPRSTAAAPLRSSCCPVMGAQGRGAPTRTGCAAAHHDASSRGETNCANRRARVLAADESVRDLAAYGSDESVRGLAAYGFAVEAATSCRRTASTASCPRSPPTAPQSLTALKPPRERAELPGRQPMPRRPPPVAGAGGADRHRCGHSHRSLRCPSCRPDAAAGDHLEHVGIRRRVEGEPNPQDGGRLRPGSADGSIVLIGDGAGGRANGCRPEPSAARGGRSGGDAWAARPAGGLLPAWRAMFAPLAAARHAPARMAVGERRVN